MSSLFTSLSPANREALCLAGAAGILHYRQSVAVRGSGWKCAQRAPARDMRYHSEYADALSPGSELSWLQLPAPPHCITVVRLLCHRSLRPPSIPYYPNSVHASSPLPSPPFSPSSLPCLAHDVRSLQLGIPSLRAPLHDMRLPPRSKPVFRAPDIPPSLPPRSAHAPEECDRRPWLPPSL